MSTTDTRATFEEWAESEGRTISQWPSGEYEDSLLNSQWDAVQAVAATEAAKATGTAGDLPPLPEPTASSTHGAHLYSLDKMLSYARAAIHKQWCSEVNCDAVREELAELKAARQPAPVAIKTWQERMTDGRRVQNSEWCKDEEIAELRAALAATNRSQP